MARSTQKQSNDMSEAELRRMSDALDDVLAEKASKKLRHFVPWAWDLYEGTPLVSNWHIDIIAEHIEAALKRQIRKLAITVSPRSCLKRGTEIRMWDGSAKPIEAIKVGDKVASFDIKRKIKVEGTVTANLDNKYQDTYRIGLDTGYSVIATMEHRFFTDRGYRHVSELSLGDKISMHDRRRKGNDSESEEYYSKIISLAYTGTHRVYDISVNKWDNFILANGIVSHNSKTSIASICTPAFRWITNPEERFFLSSHKLDLCTTNLIKSRNIINNPRYANRYCKLDSSTYSFRLSEDQSTKKKISNTSSGDINISSPDTGIIGNGGTVFIIDDIIDETMYQNERIRRERNNWVTDQLFGRSNDVNTDVKMAICQRLGDDDLIAHLFQKYKGEDGFFELCIPAEFAKRKTYFSPLGERWNDPRKTEGELMDKKRLPLSYLNTINPIRRKTLFQQDPSGGGKGITLDEKDIRIVSQKPTKMDSMLIMWDLTFAASTASTSWNLGAVVGRKEDSYYVIDGIRAKLDIVGQLAAIKKLAKKYPEAEIGVEAKANGEAVMRLLASEFPNIVPFRPSEWGGKAQADKEKRFGAVVPYIKNGQLYFYKPHSTDYTLDETYDPDHAINELVGFPLFSTNEWVDDISYAIGYLSQKTNNSIIMLFGDNNHKLTEDEYWAKYDSSYNESNDLFIFTDNIPSCEDISSIQF